MRCLQRAFHARGKLAGVYKCGYPQVGKFIAFGIDEHHGRHTPYAIPAKNLILLGLALGQIQPQGFKLPGQGSHLLVAESPVVEFPAGQTPIGIKIQHHRRTGHLCRDHGFRGIRFPVGAIHRACGRNP